MKRILLTVPDSVVRKVFRMVFRYYKWRLRRIYANSGLTEKKMLLDYVSRIKPVIDEKLLDIYCKTRKAIEHDEMLVSAESIINPVPVEPEIT